MAEVSNELKKILRDCQVPDKVDKWLITLVPPVLSTIEFGGLATSREGVEKVAKLAGIKDEEISAVGALRRAWIIANAELEKRTDILSGKTVEDMDSPLSEPEETAILDASNSHYKIQLPAYRLSTKGLLGRAVREAVARTFSVTPSSTYRSMIDPAGTGKLLKIPLGGKAGASVGPCLDIEVHSKFTLIRAVRCLIRLLGLIRPCKAFC